MMFHMMVYSGSRGGIIDLSLVQTKASQQLMFWFLANFNIVIRLLLYEACPGHSEDLILKINEQICDKK